MSPLTPFPEPFGSTTKPKSNDSFTEEKAAKFQKLCDIKRALEADMKKHKADTEEGGKLFVQFHHLLFEVGRLGLQGELYDYMEREGVGAYFRYPKVRKQRGSA